MAHYYPTGEIKTNRCLFGLVLTSLVLFAEFFGRL